MAKSRKGAGVRRRTDDAPAPPTAGGGKPLDDRVAKFLGRLGDDLARLETASWTESALRSALVDSVSLLPAGKLRREIERNIDAHAKALAKKVKAGSKQRSGADKEKYKLLFDDEVERRVRGAFASGSVSAEDQVLLMCRSPPAGNLMRLNAESLAAEGGGPPQAIEVVKRLLLITCMTIGEEDARAGAVSGTVLLLEKVQEAAKEALGNSESGDAEGAGTTLASLQGTVVRVVAAMRAYRSGGSSTPGRIPALLPRPPLTGETPHPSTVSRNAMVGAVVVSAEIAAARALVAAGGGEGGGGPAALPPTLPAADVGAAALLVHSLMSARVIDEEEVLRVLMEPELPSAAGDLLGEGGEDVVWLAVYDALSAARRDPGGGGGGGSGAATVYLLRARAARRGARALRARALPARAAAVARAAEASPVPEALARWLRSAPAGAPPRAVKEARAGDAGLGSCLARRLGDSELDAVGAAWDQHLEALAAQSAGGGAEEDGGAAQLFFVDTDGADGGPGGTDDEEEEGSGSEDGEGGGEDELREVGALGGGAMSEDDEDDDDEGESDEEEEGGSKRPQYDWMKGLEDDEDEGGEEGGSGDEGLEEEEEEEVPAKGKGKGKAQAKGKAKGAPKGGGPKGAAAAVATNKKRAPPAAAAAAAPAAGASASKKKKSRR